MNTPTPWNITRHATPEYSKQYGIYSGDNSSNHIIINGENAFADATLIAAAPEMLSALQRITHPMADDDDLEFALEVIKKAKGE